jgi:hypothetical protein
MTTDARWLPYVKQRIAAICADEGRAVWESEGMAWPSPALADIALSWTLVLLPDSCPAPSVTPSEDGGITLTWRKNGWHAELDTRPKDGHAAAWCYHRASGVVWDLDMDVMADRTTLREILEELADEVSDDFRRQLDNFMSRNDGLLRRLADRTTTEEEQP